MRETIFGQIPSKSNAYKIIKHGYNYSLGKTPKLQQYEKDFGYQCRLYKNAEIDKPFELILDVYFKTRASDLDGCLKILLDCLQKVSHAIKNDNLCYKITCRKHIDSVNPRVVFELKILETF